jgi:hypothetical protein
MEQVNNRLLKIQTNQLIDCIRNRANFSFDNFQLIEQNGYYVFVYKAEIKFRFQILITESSIGSNNHFEIIFYPFISSQQDTLYLTKWSEVIKQFERWLTLVFTESKGDDWWQILKNRKDNSPIDLNFDDTSNYSVQEKVNIKSEFDDVKKMIFEIGCGTADELQIIKEEIESMKIQIELLNKPAFLKYVYGALVGYLPKKITEETLKETWRIFGEKFTTEFHKLLS